MELTFYKSKEVNDGNETFAFDGKNEMHKHHKMITKENRTMFHI